MGRPKKKAKLILVDDDPGRPGIEGLDGVAPDTSDASAREPEFKINAEYARRFEHNKKREEVQQLEEKYGKSALPFRGLGKHNGETGHDSEGDSSTSEEEDDDAELATEALDAEIAATLQAIRSKDPRVYDEKAVFYSQAPVDTSDEDDGTTTTKKEKPMFLKDYHRRNIMAGGTGVEVEEEEIMEPRTYTQEQEALKRDVVKEMNAAADAERALTVEQGEGASEDNDDEGGFLVPKAKPKAAAQDPSMHQQRRLLIDEAAVAQADKDPESFLSNFMAARAWVPTKSSSLQPFDSDDEEEDERADAFETAYNMRFEDPKGSNERIMAYARDAAAKHSVRREELSGRKKARETLRGRREAEEQQRADEKARLRKLKIEEAEERVQKIRQAAGIRGKVIQIDDWAALLGGDWDDDRWEEEMSKRFGKDYYDAEEGSSDGTLEGNEQVKMTKRKKSKKPKWVDDIDINDLVPEFTDEPTFELTGDEEDGGVDLPDDEEQVADDGQAPERRKGKTNKDRLEERRQQKNAARIQKRRIEEIVDDQLDPDILHQGPSLGKASRFHYRETSPTAYGLTSKDILLASDQQLNQYAGLKKLATFRDVEKKRRDKKRLGKKARLRQWRKDTFGDENGPRVIMNTDDVPVGDDHRVTGGASHLQGFGTERKVKKRKRSSKSKAQGIEA